VHPEAASFMTGVQNGISQLFAKNTLINFIVNLSL
tara:strand:+ start:1832 stop:1936 length:105 start_codon:yes stop_codon:yes gene_type:complete